MPVCPGVHPYFAVSDPGNVCFTTRASGAYNNLNGYKLEDLKDSDFLEICSEENLIKKVKVLNNPDHHMPGHELEKMQVFRKGQKTIELETDLAAFKLMTIWRKAADSKFICVEPANIQNGLNNAPQLVEPGQSFESDISIRVIQ